MNIGSACTSKKKKSRIVSITCVFGRNSSSSQSIQWGHNRDRNMKTTAFWWLWSYCTASTVTRKKKKGRRKTFVSKKMTSVWPLWYCSLCLTHPYTHTRTRSGGVADVGTFVLWDKSCFIGTDYRFILPLQTPANITLHTNGLHQPGRDRGEEGKRTITIIALGRAHTSQGPHMSVRWLTGPAPNYTTS